MTDWTRRAFLRWLAAGLGLATGGQFLAGCGSETPSAATPSSHPTDMSTAWPPPSTDLPPAATSVTSEPGPGETSFPTGTATVGETARHPDLVVARNGEPGQLVRQALAASGGMERFVQQGDDVIVKPNICVAYHTYEYAATTNPWVVGELVKLALDAGARRVRVMDYPFGGSAEQAYVKSGIQEQVEAAGGQMEVMTGFKFVDTQTPDGVDLKACRIYDDILKADVLINVPIAKQNITAWHD